MDIKKQLQQAYRLDRLIKSNMREIEELQSLAESVSSSLNGVEKVNTSPNGEAPFERPVMKIAELQESIAGETTRLIDTLAEIRHLIYSLDDCDQILCLKYRYLDFLKWEAVASEMDLSLKQVYRIHGEALTALRTK